METPDPKHLMRTFSKHTLIFVLQPIYKLLAQCIMWRFDSMPDVFVAPHGNQEKQQDQVLPNPIGVHTRTPLTSLSDVEKNTDSFSDMHNQVTQVVSPLIGTPSEDNPLHNDS